MSQQPPRLVCRSPSRLRRCAKFRRLCSCSCWIQAGSFQSVFYLPILSPYFFFFFFFPGVKKRKNKTVTYDPPSKKHNIAVTVNGKLVSSLPPTSPDNLGKSPSPPKNPPFPNPINIYIFFKKEVGRAIGFRTQIECQLDPCGTVNKHEYLDTRVVLDKKDMSFGDTAVGNKAKATWKTPDGGLTWTADKIVVEAHTYA